MFWQFQSLICGNELSFVPLLVFRSCLYYVFFFQHTSWAQYTIEFDFFFNLFIDKLRLSNIEMKGVLIG